MTDYTGLEAALAMIPEGWMLGSIKLHGFPNDRQWGVTLYDDEDSGSVWEFADTPTEAVLAAVAKIGREE